MLLCSCHAVSERSIRACIAAGARTVQDIAEKCNAGATCGGCWPALDDLLDEAAAHDDATGRRRATPAA